MKTGSIQYELFWYELDQPIAVGLIDEFSFVKNSKPLRFLSGLSDEADVAKARCLIEAIEHPELGSVKKIEPTGLEYTITLADGKEFKVDAEEAPGDVHDFPIKPTQWLFDVTIRMQEKPGKIEGQDGDAAVTPSDR